VTTVLLVSDDTVFSLGLSTLVSDDPSWDVVHVPGERSAVMSVFGRRTPDVTVLDQESPEFSTLCADVTQRRPDAPVLVLANASNGDDRLLEAVRGGARGYVMKTSDPDQLLAAMKAVADGQGFLDPTVTLKVISWVTRNRRTEHPGGLSPREMEVLALVLEGEPNKRIARRMGLTENTVKTYLRRAYRKLGCHTRSAAAAALARRGFL
jgi:two-component system NarL family response regulator